MKEKEHFSLRQRYASCDLEMNQLRFILFFNQQLDICMHKST